MSDDDQADLRSASELRLDEHLELLRRDREQGDRSLVERVMRAARWQRVVRAPLRAAASLLGAVADGLGVLAAGRRRP